MKSRHKSFTDPDTHYHLIKSDTPPSVDGFRISEPTGEVQCQVCEAVAANVDEIPHATDCSQNFARPDWWVQRLFDG